MKATRVREQTDEELRRLLGDATRELAELRVRKSIKGSVDQPMRLRTLRRDIARVRTVMRQRGFKDHG